MSETLSRGATRRAGGSRPGEVDRRRALVAVFDRLVDAVTESALRARLGRYQRFIGVTRIGIVAVAGAILLWSLAYIVAGTAMYLFAYGAVLLVGICIAIAPRKLRLDGVREGLFPRVQEGTRLDVELKLTARRRVSTFLLEERVPEKLGKTVRLPITRLSSGSEVIHRYGLRAARRGVYQVGPLVAVASDPLGLAQRETVIAEPFELLVHPRIELVQDRPLSRAYEDPPIRPPVSRPWPSGMELYGIREYKPGDDVRRIVWRASARTGKVMVREAEQGITDKITIMLDTDRGNHSRDGEAGSESFETGVRAAASLAVRHLREGYEVMVETNAGPLTRRLRQANQQLPMLDAFSRVELDRAPVTQMIQRMLMLPSRDAHTVLITPKLGAAEAAQLKLLLNTGVSILILALLWDEDDASTVATAAALGCQVVGIHPGQDLATALYHTAGSG